MLNMKKLMFNYLKPSAFFLLGFVSLTILISFLIIPHDYAYTLADFYSRYWHILTALFFIALSYSFYVLVLENFRAVFLHPVVKHAIAGLFLLIFTFVFIHLFEAGSIIFAMLK